MSRNSDIRQDALDAIKTFERDRCHGGLSKPDSALLSRLRSDKYRDEIISAWSLIGQHRKSAEDDQLLIGCIFSAWHFAVETPEMLNTWKPVVEDFQRLRQCANHLRAFFEGGRILYNGSQVTAEIDQLSRSMSWATEMFDRGEREILTLPTRLRLNRKRSGSSADNQRLRFTSAMCEAMLAIFGQPLYPAVAALANIVLKIEITGDKVRAARRKAG